MQKEFSLADLATRFHVSRRKVWEWMLAFPQFLKPAIGAHGLLEFPAMSLKFWCVIASAARNGFSESETLELLSRRAEEDERRPEGKEMAGTATAREQAGPHGVTLATLLRTLVGPIQRRMEALQEEIDNLKSRPA